MYKKILAPLDGSELSETILEHVKAVATGCQVPEVVLLRVIEPLSPLAYTETSVEALANAEKADDKEAKDYLTKVAGDLKKEGIAAQTATALGMPADKILEFVDESKADLIVMCTHGRSGVSRWVFGSVADRIIRHSPVPVLIAPPPGRTHESRD